MSLKFTSPGDPDTGSIHHHEAAASNIAVTDIAIHTLAAVLEAEAEYDKILLRAAAGAGKSYTLVRMVTEAVKHPACHRVAVTAFANKQVFPLAERLGEDLGATRVCLFMSADRIPEIPPETIRVVTVATQANQVPSSAEVVLGTSHRLGAPAEESRLLMQLGPAANGTSPFDVLMVDEAWQLPLHRFATVEGLAPLAVGVGDVGQLPPLDPSENPWRGDTRYNPYRAWPTEFVGRPSTFSIDLPAVWRPRAEQLALWRAFYRDWDRLDCVAAPGDRSISLPQLRGRAATVWETVASGIPALLEVDGLPDPDAPDVDSPLLGVLGDLLEPLLAGGFVVHDRRFDGSGTPQDRLRVKSSNPKGDPLIVLLATRNQAVDDATQLASRLTDKYRLPDGVIQASTVDSWQGQTNRITVAIHPLSGASRLDEFNSAFGRLAVTCTRATHGLLVLTRAGIEDLLDNAPARPGTPFGEPGSRSLPRQTHQRILETFARGLLIV